MIPWIPDGAPAQLFPPTSHALADPNGLLCAGGDLSVPRLLEAYRRGIFPWFNDDDPILWWAPDPRTVLFPERFHASRSLVRTLRRGRFTLSADTVFADVVRACAAPRAGAGGTWITPDMFAAYNALHAAGHAHSIECWQDGRLAGGVYGVALGAAFFGESMFSAAADASKVALAYLCSGVFQLVDCQLPSSHLHSLGAVDLARERFERLVAQAVEMTRPVLAPQLHDWQARYGVVHT